MAAITVNAAGRTMKIREQLNTTLSACREMLDAFVSGRMRHAVAEAQHVRRRQPRNTPPPPPADQTEAPAVRFVPLDPDVLSATIPAFFIGRNRAGLWVAREAQGRTGGLFLLKRSALAFARAWSGTAGCATIFPDARFELDLANDGNPLVARLANLIRLATGMIA